MLTAAEMGSFFGLVQWTLLQEGQFLILHAVDWINHFWDGRWRGRSIVEGTRVSLSQVG